MRTEASEIGAQLLRHAAQFPLEELEMDIQRIERVADLVRDAGREQA